MTTEGNIFSPFSFAADGENTGSLTGSFAGLNVPEP